MVWAFGMTFNHFSTGHTMPCMLTILEAVAILRNFEHVMYCYEMLVRGLAIQKQQVENKMVCVHMYFWRHVSPFLGN